VLQIVTNSDAVAVAAPLANEALYEALAGSGLDEVAISKAGDLIVDYVNGYVLGAAGMPDNLSEAGRESFDFGLATIVRGLEAAVEDARGGAA
jgi:hypothetical protein